MPATAPTILRRILARKREEVVARRSRVALHTLEQRGAQQAPVRGFAAALARRTTAGDAAVIWLAMQASVSGRGAIARAVITSSGARPARTSAIDTLQRYAGKSGRVLFPERNVDGAGRLLAYLWRRDDGLFVNGSLVDDGFADTLSIEPNVAHRRDLSARRAVARAAGRGMWGSCPRAG